MKILNFGSLNLDYVYSVDHFVAEGETLASSVRNTFCARLTTLLPREKRWLQACATPFAAARGLTSRSRLRAQVHAFITQVASVPREAC